MNHENYMRRAITLALAVPQHPFGAVIVNRTTGDIVAEGYNQSAHNPTYHGEMVAINRCAEMHQPKDWTALDLYTTAEPCVMCQGAILWAGIANVYYGTSIPYLKAQHWHHIDIRASDVSARSNFGKTTLVGGILEAECNALFDHAPSSIFKA